ncbi:MAG: rod shape-determining protein MreC [Minisyncoccia bacterium]
MRKNPLLHFLFFGVVIIIALFFLFKLYQGQRNNIQTASVTTLASLRGTVFTNILLNSSSWLNDFLHFNTLRNKLIDLEKTNSELLTQNLTLQELTKENLALTNALKLKQDNGWHLIPSQVVLMDPTGLSGKFWINKGGQDGLKVGMNVISTNKILLGVITECNAHYSQVESIFAPQIKIGVEDLNSQVLAVLERNTEGKYILTLVPQGANVNGGDFLITSAENKNFLKGLLVAQVKEIIPSSNVIKNYLTEPFLNSHQIDWVFVITDFIPQNASFH